MDLRKIAKDSAQTLTNYLTFQAVKTVIEQLSETDPPVAIWLRQFSADFSFQKDSEFYIQQLLKNRQELGFRVMTVREHLADNIPEFLTEMVKSQVHTANLDQRRHLFERLTTATGGGGPDGTTIHPEVTNINEPERS
ncbi:MAG: chaperonin family protein RbcX [Cyanobacteria bacterium P01_H01_bin.121]